MPTKHELIIQFIDSLAVGEKVSVRSIAKNMKISEGTAYRAIKEAEKLGLVSTIERVGTIRVERKTKRNFESLTYEAVEKIVEGQILGGHSGITKQLNKFIIGAMQEDAMLRYITPDSLMIVGNRTSVQRLALESGAAVLITGGFETTPDIISLANQVGLPIITTSYDTFTVATIINRAMSDQLIKKEIVLVENIYTELHNSVYLTTDDTVAKYRELTQTTNHTRFPVITPQGRLVGIVAAADVMRRPDYMSIEKVMTKSPVVAKTYMSIASVSHIMIWDGLDVLPVVEDNMQFIGIISRRDVMKAIQLSQRQPQVGNTIEDQIVSNLNSVDESGFEQKEYIFQVEPQMLNSVGTISYGVLAEIITESSQRMIYEMYQQGAILEQLQLYYFKLIQNENKLHILCDVLDANRRSTKIDVGVYNENRLVAKAVVSYQVISKT
ncbi:CBS domain-containing protein [Granulicatella sp. zg-ZJ]|uniref:DRTGG domain-containing protein n=1 Tax=unclassified Granulicatella TaxID=2630493 RepID=UPI0013C14144|nr:MULTISPECIES: DRTGG domain-containing protein [unclassified Granulicatella]NEW62881.1 CBS domain-containing protein [Granulicatella sp. zg-ZJ]NEW66326.1 CBS domain-containing protein [Granulicatella sp. zg-84]QMI85391.1 CBS domain-containing protein [Carnobacteriaceae bacterium zg-84]